MENTNKKIEIIKKRKIPDLKSITKIKNLLKEFNSRSTQAGEKKNQ